MNKVIEFKAIGTHWWINIYDKTTEEQLSNIEEKILELTLNFEKLYSRFLDDSLVSKINRGEQVEITNDLAEMLDISNQVKNVTQGHFDINIGGTLENLGYDSDYSFTKRDARIESKIDLGGIGKGYLINKVKDLIINNGFKYFFINAGGDIFATSNFDEPIEFILQNPFDITQAIGSIKINNQSIAASAPNLRSWHLKDSNKKDSNKKDSNKKVHHLIDYKTGEPVTEIVGVFTLADSVINADLASTALFVSPIEIHKQIAEHLRSEYLIVFKDSSFKASENYSGLLN